MSESTTKSEIVSYPRIIDASDMDAFEIYLTKLRTTDAKHDFHSSIHQKYITETIPDLSSNSVERNNTGISEDKILKEYVYDDNSYASKKYILHRNVPYFKVQDNDEETNDDDKNIEFESFYSGTDKSRTLEEIKNDGTTQSGTQDNTLSAIETKLKECILEGDNKTSPVDIFLHVDTAYKSFKRDISYFEKYRLFWVNSKTQKYDPAGKTNPKTAVGKKMCGWGNNKNTNLFYAWEDTRPGIKQNLFYPKWEPGKYTVLESYVFTPYNIFMQTTNDEDVDDYTKHESNIVIYDPDINKYVYADKSLSNKNASNLDLYTELVKKNMNSIKRFFTDFSLLSRKPQNSPFNEASLVVSKFMGDASQYLFAGLSGIHYKYLTNQVTPNKEVVSGRYNAFVSIDKVAITGAINAGVPIVIRDRGKTFDMFILKEIENRPKDPVAVLETRFKNLTGQIQQLNGELDALKAKQYNATTIIAKYGKIKNYIIDYFKTYAETSISTDEMYKNFIKLICFLIVPFNFSSEVNTNGFEVNVPDSVNHGSRLIEINNSITDTSITPEEIASLTSEIKNIEQEVADKKTKCKDLNKKFNNIERIVAVNSYFTISVPSIYSVDTDTFDFSVLYIDNQPYKKIFKSIQYLLGDVKPFSTIEKGDVHFSRRFNDEDKLLPKAVQIFMTTQLVEFLHSLDSDLGSGPTPTSGNKTVKEHVTTILNNLFSQIKSKCETLSPQRANYKQLVEKQIIYLKENTPLKDLTNIFSEGTTGGSIGGGIQDDILNESEENLLKAITLIYILINICIYNNKTKGVTIKYTDGTDIALMDIQQGRVPDEGEISSTPIIEHEFDLDIVSFPIDMIFNYLDNNINADYITNFVKKLSTGTGIETDRSTGDSVQMNVDESIGNSDAMELSEIGIVVDDTSLKTDLLTLYDKLHISIEDGPDITPLNIHVDVKFKYMFRYIHQYLNKNDSAIKPELKENASYFKGIRMFKHVPKQNKNGYPVDKKRKISQDDDDDFYQIGPTHYKRGEKFAKLDYRRGRSPPSHSGVQLPKLLRGFFTRKGGNQTKKKRTTHRKILNKPYNQKRTKRFVKKRKYQTLKKQKQPKL